MADFGLEFSEIYERIQKKSNTKNITNSATDAKAAANDAVLKIAADRRWLILRRTGTITPIDGQQSYALTGLTGFNFPVRCYYVLNGIEQPIRIVSEQEWAEKSDNDSKGTPSICAFLKISGAVKVYFSLLPSAAFIAQHSTISIDYDKKPAKLVNDTDVPEIPGPNNQLSIVYIGAADLVLDQGDISGSTALEAKGFKELNKAFVSDIHFTGIKRKPGKPAFGVLTGVNRQRPQRDYQTDYRQSYGR